jgi:hypothetical protein
MKGTVVTSSLHRPRRTLTPDPLITRGEARTFGYSRQEYEVAYAIYQATHEAHWRDASRPDSTPR